MFVLKIENYNCSNKVIMLFYCSFLLYSTTNYKFHFTHFQLLAEVIKPTVKALETHLFNTATTVTAVPFMLSAHVKQK